MLPFFRKISWRLAANNQFFKYSRYAIGEIVLVVVGILIALYINNWNEQRKEREKFDQVLVEVLSYQEETVEAGTFLAYKIQFKGKITNSRGYSANADEVWLYAPEVKNFIKLTQIQDDFRYEEELIEYSKPE